MPNVKITIGKRLREYMSEHNMRQVDVIEKCKPYFERKGLTLSRMEFSKYVNDKYLPRENKLNAIAEALNVNPGWLLGADNVTIKFQFSSFFNFELYVDNQNDAVKECMSGVLDDVKIELFCLLNELYLTEKEINTQRQNLSKVIKGKSEPDIDKIEEFINDLKSQKAKVFDDLKKYNIQIV